MDVKAYRLMSFLYPNNKVVVRDGFSLSHMEGCTHIIVLGIKKWKNGRYVNSIGNLLGMCTYYSYSGVVSLSWVREIQIINGWVLEDIRFSECGGLSWDTMKPTLLLRNHKGEERKVTLENYSGWVNDFPELFKMVYSQKD